MVSQFLLPFILWRALTLAVAVVVAVARPDAHRGGLRRAGRRQRRRLAAREPGIPGPWGWLGRLPVLESVFPARFAFVVTVCVALILALALHEASAQLSTVDRPSRRVMVVAVAAALLPVMPTPLPVRERPPVPEFITAGQWTDYVRPGHTLVVAPRPDGGYAGVRCRCPGARSRRGRTCRVTPTGCSRR